MSFIFAINCRLFLALILLIKLVQSDINIVCLRTFEGCRSERVEHEVDYDVCHDTSATIVSDKAGLAVTAIVYQNGSAAENLTFIGSLYIENAEKLYYLPSGIKKILPHLIKIAVVSSGLVEIKREDMAQFGADLEIANFYDNPIEALPSDLFVENPNLKIVEFSKCTLKTVYPIFFSNLNNLKEIDYVGMAEAGCMDQKYFKDDAGVEIQKFEWKYTECKK